MLPYKEKKADPNRYYEVLGLERNQVYTMDQVHKAFRLQARRYHPDGTEPDRDKYEEIVIAYSILSDPDTRKKYDDLDGTKLWVDARVAAVIARKLMASKVSEEEFDTLVGSIRAKVEPPPNWIGPPPGYCYYHYADEMVPTEDERDTWISHFKDALWMRQRRGEEVKVGFTTQDPHVVEKPWGTVYMVSGIPNIAQVLALLETEA